MTIRWAAKALADVERVYAFVASVDPARGAAIVEALVNRVERLTQLPRVGQRVSRYEPREVRRIFVGDYELRYELQHSTIIVLRVWHTKEDR
jgi:plasmid stabilization system protein ParE